MKSWVRSNCRTLSPQDALSVGTAAFNSLSANAHEIEWLEKVQKTADDAIVDIQRHPAVLYEYRRFIVVQGSRDRAVVPTSVGCSLEFICDTLIQIICPGRGSTSFGI
jgi:hypothetical protein